MNLLKRIFCILNNKEKRECTVLIFAMILGAFLEAIGIGLIFPLLNILEDNNFLDKYGYLKKHLASIGVLTHTDCVLFFVVVLAILCVFKNLYMYWLIKKQVNFTLNIQVSFAQKLMTLYLWKPYLYHLNNNTALLIRNIQTSLPAVFSVMIFQILFVITEIIIIIAIWLMLSYIDIFVATIIMGFFSLIIYLFLHLTRKKIIKQ